MRKNSRTYLFTLLLMLTVIPALAQSWLDYDHTLTSYPMLQTRNTAALTTFNPIDSTQFLLGEARLTAATQHGYLDGVDVAPHNWDAQAQVRSIYRISRCVVLRGGMDYSYSWGKQVGGSVWIYPEQMPFNITETDDSTRGDFSLETYRLDGQLGVDVGHGVSIGAQFDYTTASGAKKKDPRHVNSLMRCETSVGAMWHLNHFSLGGNYLFSRMTEGLKFSTFGRTDLVYHYLVDHGAYFGREENTDGNGYTDDDNERPLLDISHGLAIQAAYRLETMSWGFEASWAHRHGHYGLESPSMIDFNRHNGNMWDVKAWWQRDMGTSLQRVAVSYSHRGINDYERIYRIITDQGVTDTRYYDDRQMGKHDYSVFNAMIDMGWGINRQLPTWQIIADMEHSRRMITASVFPFYRQQSTHLTEVKLRLMRNWITNNDQVWSGQLLAGWAGGGGTANHDGTYQTPSSDAAKPLDHTLYLMRQYESLTAQRMLAGVQLRWSKPIAYARMRLYVEANYKYCQAFDVHYLEDGHRHQVAISVGCLF